MPSCLRLYKVRSTTLMILISWGPSIKYIRSEWAYGYCFTYIIPLFKSAFWYFERTHFAKHVFIMMKFVRVACEADWALHIVTLKWCCHTLQLLDTGIIKGMISSTSSSLPNFHWTVHTRRACHTSWSWYVEFDMVRYDDCYRYGQILVTINLMRNSVKVGSVEVVDTNLIYTLKVGSDLK